jgi:CheY-like chemotaxis protein
MTSVLLVEDSAASVAWVKQALPGDEVMDVPTLARGLALLTAVRFDLVITDVRGVTDRPPLLAVSALRTAMDRAGSEHVAILLTSGVDPFVLHGIAGSVRNTHALPKPFSRNDLRSLVERVTT